MPEMCPKPTGHSFLNIYQLIFIAKSTPILWGEKEKEKKRKQSAWAEKLLNLELKLMQFHMLLIRKKKQELRVVLYETRSPGFKLGKWDVFSIKQNYVSAPIYLTCIIHATNDAYNHCFSY